MDISNTTRACLIIIRHVFIRYPLFLLYLYVLYMLIKNFKKNYNTPFYIILISLGFSDIMFACALELWSMSNVTDEVYARMESFVSSAVNVLWLPSNLVAPATNFLISGFRFGAVAFPFAIKVKFFHLLSM